jgi:hypothetical protein
MESGGSENNGKIKNFEVKKENKGPNGKDLLLEKITFLW